MTHAPTQFTPAVPNPQLTVGYAQALYFVQLAFKRFPHGGLKKFAAENSLHYNTLISLRNNALRRVAPLQVHKAMKYLGFESELVRITRGGGHEHEYVFPSVEVADRFHQHLKEYENPTPPTNPYPVPSAGE